MLSESGCVVEAINKLSKQMRTSISVLSERFDQLESSLDDKIKRQVNDTVAPAFTKIKEDFNAEISKVREEMKAVAQRSSQANNQTYSQVASNGDNDPVNLNFIVRNLRESDRENVVQKVNTLISEGLNMSSVFVSVAVRKQSRNEHHDGVVVATCKNRDDKNDIMRRKSVLKDSRRYQNVFIKHDRSRE